jgi:hypothetical protein
LEIVIDPETSPSLTYSLEFSYLALLAAKIAFPIDVEVPNLIVTSSPEASSSSTTSMLSSTSPDFSINTFLNVNVFLSEDTLAS